MRIETIDYYLSVKDFLCFECERFKNETCECKDLECVEIFLTLASKCSRGDVNENMEKNKE